MAERVPLIVVRKVQTTGSKGSEGAYTLALPKEWCRAHGVEPKSKLLLVGDKHLLIVSPKENELYDLITKFIQGRIPRGSVEKAVLASIRAGDDGGE